MRKSHPQTPPPHTHTTTSVTDVLRDQRRQRLRHEIGRGKKRDSFGSCPNHGMSVMPSYDIPIILQHVLAGLLADPRHAALPRPPRQAGMRPHSVLTFQILPQGSEQVTHLATSLSQSRGQAVPFRQSFSNSVTSANAYRPWRRVQCRVPRGAECTGKREEMGG